MSGYGWSPECDAETGFCACGAVHKPFVSDLDAERAKVAKLEARLAELEYEFNDSRLAFAISESDLHDAEADRALLVGALKSIAEIGDKMAKQYGAQVARDVLAKVGEK